MESHLQGEGLFYRGRLQEEELTLGGGLNLHIPASKGRSYPWRRDDISILNIYFLEIIFVFAFDGGRGVTSLIIRQEFLVVLLSHLGCFVLMVLVLFIAFCEL